MIAVGPAWGKVPRSAVLSGHLAYLGVLDLEDDRVFFRSFPKEWGYPQSSSILDWDFP